MKLADRLETISFSKTLSMGQRAAALRAAGRDIISLGLGEPDTEIPEIVRRATAAAAMEGNGRSAPVEGLPGLREAIAQKLGTAIGLPFLPEQILVSSGTKQVIFNAMMATLDPGDEVIIPAPYWVSYPDIVRIAEGVPVAVVCPAEAEHKIQPAQLESAITSRTRWLILNSPNNPTGCVYTVDELHALAAVLRAHPQVFVLSDDIYEYLDFNGTFVNMAMVAPDLSERILTVNGLSKTYAMIGWRIGYGAGPLFLIKAMAKIQSQVTSGTATIVQKGAIAALTEVPVAGLGELGRLFKRRTEIAIRHLRAIDGITFCEPRGAFYIYAECGAFLNKKTASGSLIETDDDLAEYLLDTAGIVTVSGGSFGLSPALRLSLTCPEERLAEAFERMSIALGSLQ